MARKRKLISEKRLAMILRAGKPGYSSDGKRIGDRRVTSAENGKQGGRPRKWTKCPRCGTPWEGARLARACAVCRGYPEFDGRGEATGL